MSQPEDRITGRMEPGPVETPAAPAVPPEAAIYDLVQAEIALYPTRRAAILPALRVAQEHYGWLSPEALQVVADAIEFSPAYCQSVASFYDMFFLDPVGTHVIEVCTNLSCGLCGAGEVVDAFEEALGIRLGETTPDGTITLRKVECLGGCGFAPVVAVDEVYHERFRPDDAEALVEEVRRMPRRHHG
ncbi:MAG TPA: NAD(P)H-dependent oxidoreductase subunit E [Solirubrobacteraceae bacterium]|jgi:NADH-quinone oxidoreductase E subunit|nr:NAD(P)H-dependent oxidoreductase subunit E [Solirubrobacteraceae bacterium]